MAELLSLDFYPTAAIRHGPVPDGPWVNFEVALNHLAERDLYKRQRDELLEAVREHMRGLPKGESNHVLWEAAKRIQEDTDGA